MNFYFFNKNYREDTLSDLLLIFCFFFLGFNKFIIYVPCFIIYLTLNFSRFTSFETVKRLYPFYIFSFLYLFIIPFAIFSGTLHSPFKSLAVMTFTFIVGGAVFFLNKKSHVKLSMIYLLGVFAECVVIVSVSYIKGGFGYGRLWDPFSEVVINSPSINNLLGIIASISYFLLNSFKRRMEIFSGVAVLLLSVFSALYLRGRAFFVIFGVGVLLSHLLISNKKSLKRSVSFFLFIISLFFLLYFLNDSVRSSIEHLLIRFSRDLGESGRARLFESGFHLMLRNPFGGFSVDPNLIDVPWFHNFWLDSARIAGWSPIFLFCFAFIYLFKKMKARILSREYAFGKLLAILALVVMFQDVIIEGNFRVYFILFIGSVPFLESERGTYE